MAGRTRRILPPTNPPPPEESIRHYKETSILKPVGPSTHTDDWPCFLLSDATVHMRNGTPANQLLVDIMGPFIIRGRLEVEKDNERFRTFFEGVCCLPALD
ncbi:putative defective in methylation-7 protein [Rosellinia necatrix]|uniref:Putative defective in methylation-7 protein n=1 Tax=Rosellinia necatrix TaxID=77044 RepID=A0A1S8A9U3_ROSNE|nr:putative defective in methylation-7 protein [Rosellinia necatrix]